MEHVVVGGELFSLGEMIGKGGEGRVFALNGRSGAAVKLYNSRLRIDREEKVRAMVHRGYATQTDLVAYPREVVFDRVGNFLGFLMQLVSGYRPIHELYSPKSRQRHFPNVDYRFIVHVALNVARAVGKVHQTGCVIGDLNHSGVLVAQDGKVALIDADSFQFRLGQKTYPCVVGVQDFLPPELHDVNLSAVTRSVEHDNFGLAVLVFLLLLMGRHPYAGRHNGPDLPLGQAIAQNKFAFSLLRQASTGIIPPPGALALDVFPALIRQGFETAFGLDPAARPNASSWIRALTTLKDFLRRCDDVKSHFYPDSAKGCTWCAVSATAGGIEMFPEIAMDVEGIPGDTRATEQAIREFLALQFPVVAELVPKSMTSSRKRSVKLREAKKIRRGQALIGLLMLAGSGVGLFYAAVYWFVWLGLAGWGAVLIGSGKVKPKPFHDAFLQADQALEREIDTFVGRSGLAEVAKMRADVLSAIPIYRSIDDHLKEELVKLKSTHEARQRAAFLDRFLIQRAIISGIGPVRKATLVSFGIETAADINQFSVRQVPGFGDVMTRNLLEWRHKLESRFRYEPSRNAQDVADESRLQADFAKRKGNLEAVIRNGSRTLRTAKPRLNQVRVRAREDKALMDALDNWLRAEKDLEILGAKVPSGGLSTREVLQPREVPARSTQYSRQQVAPSTPKRTQSVPSCPQCGSAMRRRSGRRGAFWGCSRYPSCRGTRNI